MSRIDPNNITVSYFGSQRFVVLPGSNTQCICISLIYVHDCSLISGKQSGETRSKKVGGVLHIQEMERLAACFCMQYDMVPELNANAYGWVLYFNTRSEDFESRSRKSMSTIYCMPGCSLTLLLDSPIKGGHSSNTASAASQFNFFSQYPGTAPKVQLHSAGSPLKAQTSKASRLLKPILDFRDIGMFDKWHILQ